MARIFLWKYLSNVWMYGQLKRPQIMNIRNKLSYKTFYQW